MITIQEIRNIAARVSLANTVVEKDYALGWLLWGIFQHKKTKTDWVFKGGTCLKKCYLETFRFSEDLDFSFRGKNQPIEKSLINIFSEISDLIFENSGLEFLKESIKFEIFQNSRGSNSIQGGIKYRSVVRPQVGIKHMQRIKIDLTLDEFLVHDPVTKKVDHPYSDKPKNGISVLSYTYEEVFAEKIRALAERLRPRDLYDVIHLFRCDNPKPSQQKIHSTLKSKCQLRGIKVPTMTCIQNHKNIALLKSEWANQLKHQIRVLPSFQSFLGELPNVLNWIQGNKIKTKKTFVDIQFENPKGSILTLPAKSLFASGPPRMFFDKVRFAAANRLVLNLKYEKSWKKIEPFALARNSKNDLLLRAIQTENRELCEIQWNKIQDLEVTDKTFTPTFKMEITSAVNLTVHQLSSPF